MADVVEHLRRLGGFATRRQLLARGVTVDALAAAVRAGRLGRPRRGWYTEAALSDPAFRAVAVGGRLTGLSAIEAMGGWLWNRPERIQVAVARDASRLADRRARHDVDVHWEPDAEAGTAAVVGVADALVRAFLDSDLESAIVAADWALHLQTIDPLDYSRVVGRLPSDLRVFAALADGSSESPLESVTRLRLVLLGFRVVTQQRVGKSGRFDLLVEDVVAIEVDGRIHESTFEADRAKDLAITVEGRHCLRITHRMLRNDWANVVLAIDAALAARRSHRSGVPVLAPPISGTSRYRSPIRA
ncbi:MAG: hypothetical protein HY996_11230 [Micrococcales bacterium]|nr:hypothetical protein [Micrococcales bacterium]